MITIACNSCGKQFRVKSTTKAFRCANCKGVVRPSNSPKKQVEKNDSGETADFSSAEESQRDNVPKPAEAATLPPSAPSSETPTVPPNTASSETPTVPPQVPSHDEAVTVAPSKPSGRSNDSPTDRGFADVPGYEILGELGRGGMGVVYKARHLKLNRVVALKMILSGGHASDADISRFLSEAEAVAAFQHPNIVQVFEIGHHQGLPFMALEFVDGGSLGGKLKKGPLSAKEAARMVEQIARGMNAAHQGGIVHRDLKPDNVLLTKDGTPKVTDFGLAKKVEGGSGLTQTGAIMGTPSYMAPEQAGGDGKRVGPAADVYALGAVLYACLTGRPPFQAGSVMDTILQVVSEEPKPPKQLNRKVPKDLETICLKCLAKQEQKRYASAHDLAEDLRCWREGEPITARPVGSFERSVKWVKRNAVVAGLLFFVFVCLIAGVAVSTWFGIQARISATDAKRSAKVAEQKADAEAKANDKLQTLLYVSDMRMAHFDWQNNNLARMQETLKRHGPGRAYSKDMRGFEWHYLKRLTDCPLMTFTGHASFANDAALSADGKRLIVQGRLKVKIWDAVNGKELFTLPRHSLSCVALSADGKRMVFASTQNLVEIWDVVNPRVLRTLKGHSSYVNCVAMSADGNRIVAGLYNHTMAEWDANDGQLLRTFKPIEKFGRSRSVALSADGSRIVAGSEDGTLTAWHAGSDKEAFMLKGQSVACVAMTADGKQIIAGTSDGMVKIWDADNGALLRILQGHSDAVRSVVISTDGKRIVSGSADGTVRIWDAESGRHILTINADTRSVLSVTLGADDKRIVSAGYSVKMWDAINGQESVTVKGHAGRVTCLAMSPDEKRIISASETGTVIVSDAASGRKVHTLKGPGACWALNTDGKQIIAVNKFGALKVWDADNGKEVRTLIIRRFGIFNASIVLTKDCKRIVAASKAFGGRVKIWDTTEDRRQLFTLSKNRTALRHVALSADEQRIVAVDAVNRMTVWDIVNRQEVFSFKGHSIRSVALSADGKRIISGGYDGTARVWDADNGRELAILKGHSAPVTCVLMSPDGKQIVSGSDDRTVRIWDAVNGQELLTLKGHSGTVTSLLMSPDGMRIVSGSADGMVKVWDARSR